MEKYILAFLCSNSDGLMSISELKSPREKEKCYAWLILVGN